jgi:DNA mismatch repair ATPase MutS
VVEGKAETVKAHLMYRDADFDLKRGLPPNEAALVRDLELNTLLEAMSCGDKFLFQVTRQALLSGLCENADTIGYRQAALKDCLKHDLEVRRIYNLAVEAIETKRTSWLGVFSRSPGGILYDSLKLLQLFVDVLEKLRRLAEEYAQKFESEAFAALFKMLRGELSDGYFASVKGYLKELRSRDDVLVSAELGSGNEIVKHTLRRFSNKEPRWYQRVFARRAPAYTYRLAERDEAGARALSDLRDRGLNLVANALAQSADHLLSFFVMLRIELAFYVGCANLHRRLMSAAAPICFPAPCPPESRRHQCAGLRDVGLLLTSGQTIIGNDLRADGKRLVIITGANQGGKSTFLRSLGVAQIMMQCGMFVAADSFTAEICDGLFTHYKREEDAALESGKFDEELNRMSVIVDSLAANSIVLFNESFAATNEREGSEIARQIVQALLEKGVRIIYVTHLIEFARSWWEKSTEGALFLRAERQTDGHRTFKVIPGEPLQTSFGADLYDAIFGNVSIGKAPDLREPPSAQPDKQVLA